MILHNYLNYLYTNETLDAIIGGLDLKRDDKVLSILGSGDQAFAMLEYSSVIATDRVRAQLKFVNKRIKHLKNSEFDDFLMRNYSLKDTKEYVPNVLTRSGDYVLDFINLRNEYFLRNKNRLNNIRDRIDNLKILNNNILNCTNKEFNKIYFSNALTNGTNITKLVDILPNNGLIYISNSGVVNRIIEQRSEYKIVKDEELSKLAKDSEYISFETPGVYRKISS